MSLTFRILSTIKSIDQLLPMNLHCSEDNRVRACAAYFFQHLAQEEIARFFSVPQLSGTQWIKQALDSAKWGPYDCNRSRMFYD
ncbi:hypothetical protein P9112_013470 [Eukaryota sp. TZLM1-RC]